MERKNTILLTVIAVATLLVAVVGATFAYFTATTTTEGANNSNIIDVTTEEKSAVTITGTGYAGYGFLNLPGGKAYTGYAVTDDATNRITYDLKLAFQNNTQTDLKWQLYTSKSAFEGAASLNCREEQVPTSTETQYFYTCTGFDTANFGTAVIIDGDELTNYSGVAQSLTVEDGKVVLPKGTSTNLELMLNDVVIEPGAGDNYYYLVVEYPNATNEQNDDQGRKILAQIVGMDGVTAVVPTQGQ